MEYARRFSSARVSVLGDVMLDRYFWGDVERISPEAPVPIVRVTRRSARLGGAANVAANLRALGVRVDIAGVVGDDREGEEVRALLAEDAVGDEGLITVRRWQTTEKVRIIARSQQVVRADFEAGRGLDGEVSGALVRAINAWPSESDALLVSDYGKGVLSEEVLREVIPVWRAAGKPVLVDPHVGHFPWYHGATLMTPNVKEAVLGGALPPGTKTIGSEAAFALRERLEIESLLITRGEEGMSLYFGDRREVHIPTVAKEVYDVTGAGDTVIGVLAAAVASKVDLVDAVVLANQAAGEVVKEVGTSAVTTDALITSFKT